jgi:hypothetical protein
MVLRGRGSCAGLKLSMSWGVDFNTHSEGGLNRC